ncbi:uncharacterized protein MEPE_05450 [Melanopsichium pennsylvanicum]|uniref:Uncharacterized protein n=1 Tax=Melanopsichium pennsylvanicum TaxID=63383 RepID=A0AAJ4XRV1_9BASI|nr:uncharacterized protein MEPE_05450 [Melanopsichium pennsylvanicum]
MSSTSNTAPSAASSQPASTQMPALRAEEPVRRSARLRKRDPATRAVATLSAAGLEATTPSSPAAGKQPIEIVAAEQLVALRATPQPLEPLFLGNDSTGEEEERLEAMEVEESVVGGISEVGEDPVTPLVGPHVPNYLEIALWAESLIAPVLLVFVACGAWPPAWVVLEGSVTAGRLHWLVLLRLTEGCMPWPSWQCARCAKLGVPAGLRALVCTAILAATRSACEPRGCCQRWSTLATPLLAICIEASVASSKLTSREREVEGWERPELGVRDAYHLVCLASRSAHTGTDDDRGILRSSAANAVHALALRGYRASFGAWVFVSPQVCGVVCARWLCRLVAMAVPRYPLNLV